MVNAHPRLAIMGEVHYFDRIVRLKERFHDLSTREDRESFFRLLPRVEGIQYLADIDTLIEEVKARLDADPNPTLDRFYELLLRAYSQREGKPRFGDKSLEHVRHLDRLVALFPDARIVHLVRDPRAVVESMLRMPWAPEDVLSTAAKWRANVWSAAEFSDRDHRMLEVRYEDIVTHPQEELQRICSFIGEEFDEQMLRHHESPKSYIRNEPWKNSAATAVRGDMVEQWRQRLLPWQIAMVEKIAGRLMARYRYEWAQLDWSASLSVVGKLPGEVSRYFSYKRRDEEERREKYEVVLGDSAGALLRLLLRSLHGVEKKSWR
jgi:hypothetical protein